MYHLPPKLCVAVVGALLAATVAPVSCMSGNKDNQIWLKQPVSFNLSTYGRYPPSIEFSKSGEYICLDWHLTSGWHSHERLVLSLQGEIIDSAVDHKGRFRDKYTGEFPGAWPRTSGHLLSSRYHQTTDAATLFPYPEFVANAGQWILDTELTYGLKLVDPKDADTGEPVSVTDQGKRKIWAAEFWQFNPVAKRLWRISLPPEVSLMGDGHVYTIDGTAYLMVAYLGSRALILSVVDGSVVRTIDYNDYVADVKHLVQNDVPGRFSAWEVSFSPDKVMLACGGFGGTQFIVISFENNNEGRRAYASRKSLAPVALGGVWNVHRIEFGACGKYLIVEYEFAGRSTDVVEYRTEVYETDGWREVWSMQSRTRNTLILSPNGKHAAMIRADGGATLLDIGEPVME